MTTRVENFQKFIRAEKDKQHMYTQDRYWTAVNECTMEVKSLARRQARLGELGLIEAEKYRECGHKIRSINHKMNITKVNSVQGLHEQVKLDKQKQALTIESDAWKSLVDMRNSVKVPEKANPVERNKMEIDREVKAPQDQFVEKLNVTLKLRNDERAYSRQLEFEDYQRRQNVELDNEDRKAQPLKVQFQFYERMLQLCNHGVAAKLLLEIEKIATKRNRSANRVGGVQDRQ